VTPLNNGATPSAARPEPRPPMRVTASRESGVLHTALPRVDLLVWRKPGVPLVTLGIYAPRRHLDPPAQAGLGALTTRTAVRGAGGLDAGGLAFAFEELGGSLGSSAATDWLGFNTTVLAEHLGAAAVLLDLVYSEPTLDDVSVVLERGIMEEEAVQVTDDMFRYPFQLAFAEGFGNEGYGLPVAGLPTTLPTISGADVRAWHQRAFREVRPVVVAVGDVDSERASELLAGAFGRRTDVVTAAQLPVVAWVGGNGNAAPGRVVTRDKVQAALAMAFPGPSRRDSDRAAAEVWAAIASGLGGRLFEALRDRRSLAYTVMASAWGKARGGALLAYIATSPEREDEAREEMLKELARFTRERVSETELRQAVNYLSGQAEVSRQSGSAVAAEILEAWIAGTGLKEMDDPAARFRGVTTDDVLRVASRYLDSARRVEGVVRGTRTP
jgi:zinc protease